MTLKQLYYFVVVCEEFSYTSAAKRLYVTQQGLSKSIAELENELDCSLFVREKNKLHMTDAGEELLGYAKKVLNDCDELCEKMKKHRKHLKMHVDMTFGTRFALPFDLEQCFREKYPQIEFSIYEKDNFECLEDVEKGKVDAAIAIMDVPIENCVKIPICKKQPMLLVPKEHYLAQKEKVRLSDLHDLPMVLFSQTNAQMFLEQCKRFNVKPRIEFVVGEIITVYQYVSQKGVLGISVDFLKGMFYYPELVEIPFDEEEIVWELNVVVRNENINYEPVKKLIECLK